MGAIAILVNEKAGNGKASIICRVVTSILTRRLLEFTIFTNNWPTSFISFSSVWIIGGDGTLNYFVNHTTGHLPPLAIFKAGTGNDFAGHLYGKAGNSEILDIVLSAQPKMVDAGMCNGSFFLNMAGIGFDGHVLKKMNTIRWLGGFVGYYTAIIQSILSYKEPYYEIGVDGGPIYKQQFLLLLINNASTTGGGFMVSPNSDLRDGKLELLTCSPLNVLKRLIALPRIREGKHLDLPYIHSRAVEKVNITSPLPLHAQIDGDLIEAREFNISILPAHFRFLY